MTTVCATDELGFETYKTLKIKMTFFRWPHSMRMPRRIHPNKQTSRSQVTSADAYPDNVLTANTLPRHFENRQQSSPPFLSVPPCLNKNVNGWKVKSENNGVYVNRRFSMIFATSQRALIQNDNAKLHATIGETRTSTDLRHEIFQIPSHPYHALLLSC